MRENICTFSLLVASRSALALQELPCRNSYTHQRAQHSVAAGLSTQASSTNLLCAFCLQEQLRVQKVQQSKAKLQSKDRKVRSAQRERRRLRALLGQDIPDDLLQSAGKC